MLYLTSNITELSKYYSHFYTLKKSLNQSIPDTRKEEYQNNMQATLLKHITESSLTKLSQLLKGQCDLRCRVQYLIIQN